MGRYLEIRRKVLMAQVVRPAAGLCWSSAEFRWRFRRSRPNRAKGRVFKNGPIFGLFEPFWALLGLFWEVVVGNIDFFK